MHAEVVLALSATLTSGCFIWWVNISLDGETPPDVTHIVSNTLIQEVGILSTHVIDAVYTEIILRRPFLSVVRHNFRGYSICLAVLGVGMWAMVVSSLLPRTLARRVQPGANTTDLERTWLFLTNDVLAAMNVSDLCNEFPTATAFAAYSKCCEGPSAKWCHAQM